MSGIGHQVIPLPGQASVRLDEEMPPEWVVGIVGVVERLEDRQRTRSQIALGVGWCRPGGQGPHPDADWLDPLPLGSLQVLGGDQPAHGLDDVLAGPPAVEGLTAARGDRLERGGQGGTGHPVARLDRCPPRIELGHCGMFAVVIDAVGECRRLLCGDREARGCQGDRRCQGVFELQPAQISTQGLQAVDASRDGDRLAGVAWDGVVAGGAERLGGRTRARPPRRVEDTGPVPTGGVHQSEQVAAQPAGLRRHNTLRRHHGDGGVDCVAAREQDLAAGICREVVWADDCVRGQGVFRSGSILLRASSTALTTAFDSSSST